MFLEHSVLVFVKILLNIVEYYNYIKQIDMLCCVGVGSATMLHGVGLLNMGLILI